MGKRNDKWREKKGRKEGWTRQKDVCGCTECFTLKLSQWQRRTDCIFPSWRRELGLFSWRVGKMFLIFGLNHSTDKKMFLASSGNEKQKHLLDAMFVCVCVCVCAMRDRVKGRRGDNGAIVAVYTHGFQPNTTQLFLTHHTLCVREFTYFHYHFYNHGLLSLCVPIYNLNIRELSEQVEVIWFQKERA